MLGWDPVRFSAASGSDRVFADAVLQRALDLRADEIKALGIAVGNRIIEALNGK